ncbi:sigma factor-like helix-turn-helix DNA-binding protein [Streptomyces sp. SAT1]|uniref:sigma factor-like helix-turn-helix DNA-binding protein n=1 Tax=Streptomyces sp. SAT1 TaxID=1849967 RepID=UPI000D1A34FD
MPLREEIPMTPVHQGFAPGSPGVRNGQAGQSPTKLVELPLSLGKMATKKPELWVRATKKTESQLPVFGLRACRGCPPLCDNCHQVSTADQAQQVRSAACACPRAQQPPSCDNYACHRAPTDGRPHHPVPLRHRVGEAMGRLPGPTHSTSGPVTSAEHLALLATLADFSAGLETNILTATYYACEFKVSQAEIGRSCGISRQAVRQRLAKAVAIRKTHQRDSSYWDYDYDYLEDE